jgi:hypothetical protein
MSLPVDPTHDLRKRVDTLSSEIELLQKDANEFARTSERRTEIEEDIDVRMESLRKLQAELDSVQRENVDYLKFLEKYNGFDELAPHDVVKAAEPLVADVGVAVAKARKAGDFAALELYTVLLEAVLNRLSDAEDSIAKAKAESRQKSLTAAASVLKEAKEAKAETDRLDAEEAELRRKLDEVTTRRRETEAKESKEVEDALKALQVATPEMSVEPEPVAETKPNVNPEPKSERESGRLPLFQRGSTPTPPAEPESPSPPAEESKYIDLPPSQPRPPTPPTEPSPPPPAPAQPTPPPQPPPRVTLPTNIRNAWTLSEVDEAWERLTVTKRNTALTTKRIKLSQNEFARALTQDTELARILGVNNRAASNRLFTALDASVRNGTLTYSEFRQFLTRPSRRATSTSTFYDSDELFDELMRVRA